MTLTPTVHDVPLPRLGDNIDEATVTRWLIQPGERVEAADALLEVATDKVDTEITASVSGTLIEILAEEGDVVAVGAAIARIATPPPATTDSMAPASATPDPATMPAAPNRAPSPLPTQQSTQSATSAVPDQAPTPPPTASAARPAGAATRTEKLSRIRRTIARRMVESLQTSAQLTTVIEVDVTAIARLRAAHKDEFFRHTGTKLSFLPFFAKATIEALASHPTLNASLDAEATEVTYHQSCHLGIAVDSDKGLMVPVIRDAHNLGIPALAVAIANAADRTRTGKITPDELSGGTFTLTNTGSRGALFDTPIINQPQTGILGTGAVVDRVVPTPDPDSGFRISVRSMAYLSITYDHRLTDGADASRFLTTVRHRLENGFTSADLV